MKKGRDTRDVFAVFKKDSFMKDASFGKKLAYWFKNVYWYHFRVATFAVIFVAILAVVFVSDVFFREYNDVDYVVAGTLFANKDEMTELSDKMAEFVEPSDEEYGPRIGYQLICTRSILDKVNNSETLEDIDGTHANREKIATVMIDDEVLLFFFDKTYIEWYSDDGAFEPLSNFGIESDNEYFVRVDGTKFFEDIEISHTDGVYAGIKVKSGPRLKAGERMDKKYENAANVLSGILSYEG